MQYIYHSTLILIFTLSCLIIIFALKLLAKYMNINNYKITNWIYTIFCAYLYIWCLLLGLYLLRLYNIHRSLDLKIIYYNIFDIISWAWHISYIYTFLNILLLFLLTITVILTVMIIYKHLIAQIFNLYLFIRYNLHDRNNIERFINKIRKLNNFDIISFWLLKLSNYLNRRLGYYKMNLVWEKNPDIFSLEYDKKLDIFAKYCKKRPWYHFDVIISKIMGNKYYNSFIIPFSPNLVILYDCIFNHFVITRVYYYLLIYIPVLLWRRRLYRRINMEYFIPKRNLYICFAKRS